MIAVIHSIDKIGYPRFFAQNWPKTSEDCRGGHILLQTAPIRAFARDSHGINTDMPQFARSPMTAANQRPVQHISHGDAMRKMDICHGGSWLTHSLILNKCGQSRRVLDTNWSVQQRTHRLQWIGTLPHRRGRAPNHFTRANVDLSIDRNMTRTHRRITKLGTHNRQRSRNVREANFSAFVRVFCDFARIEKTAVNAGDRDQCPINPEDNRHQNTHFFREFDGGFQWRFSIIGHVSFGHEVLDQIRDGCARNRKAASQGSAMLRPLHHKSCNCALFICTQHFYSIQTLARTESGVTIRNTKVG